MSTPSFKTLENRLKKAEEEEKGIRYELEENRKKINSSQSREDFCRRQAATALDMNQKDDLFKEADAHQADVTTLKGNRRELLSHLDKAVVKTGTARQYFKVAQQLAEDKPKPKAKETKTEK